MIYNKDYMHPFPWALTSFVAIGDMYSTCRAESAPPASRSAFLRAAAAVARREVEALGSLSSASRECTGTERYYKYTRIDCIQTLTDEHMHA